MGNEADKNLENFAVVRGDWYAKPTPLSASERCKRKVKERLYALRIARQRRLDRALENVAAGVTNPMGEAMKLLERMKRSRFTADQQWAVAIEPQIAEWHRTNGLNYTTGEYTPPGQAA